MNIDTWIIVVVILALAIGIYLRIVVSRGEHGERWAKRRMQGPFVPLGEEDIAADDKRATGNQDH